MFQFLGKNEDCSKRLRMRGKYKQECKIGFPFETLSTVADIPKTVDCSIRDLSVALVEMATRKPTV